MQNVAMWNVTEGGYAEWYRSGLCRMGQKGAMWNGAEGGSADSGTEFLTQPNPNMVWSWVT